MKQLFFKIFLLIAILSGIVACTKNDNNQPGPTRMRWINVTPGLSLDIYSNREKIVTGLLYDTMTAYAAGLPSFYNLQIVKNGTSDTLISGRQQLLSGTYYSMFLVPDTTGGAINTNKVTVSTVTDNISIPNTDTSKIRFFNFAPYTPSMNVYLTLDGRARPQDTLRFFNNRVFNDQATFSGYSNFVQIMSAPGWKVNLVSSLDNITLIDTFRVDLLSRNIYTIYLKTVPGKPVTDTIGHKVLIQNN